MEALSKLSQHPPLKEIIVDSVEPTTETSTMNGSRKMDLLWRLLLQKTPKKIHLSWSIHRTCFGCRFHRVHNDF